MRLLTRHLWSSRRSLDSMASVAVRTEEVSIAELVVLVQLWCWAAGVAHVHEFYGTVRHGTALLPPSQSPAAERSHERTVARVATPSVASTHGCRCAACQATFLSTHLSGSLATQAWTSCMCVSCDLLQCGA